MAEWTRYQQPGLAGTMAPEEMHRRDYSGASIKTNDSGYNSDPEVPLSLLEYCLPDRFARLPTDVQFPRVLDFLPISVPSSFSQPSELPLSSISQGRCRSIAAIEQHSTTTTPHVDRPTPPEDDTALTHCLYKFGSTSNPKSRLCSITSLSSADSGGDYSSSDRSEPDDQHEEIMLPKSTMVTIDLVTRMVESILNRAVYIQRTRGKPSKSNSGTEPPNSRRSSVQGLQVSNSKRKARGGDDGGPEDEEGDGANKRRRVSVTTNEDSEAGPRFACPFFKHDPGRYRNRRTCPGPGWPTVHRMKEHLYRAHAQPIYCPRCYTVFDADSDFAQHLRAEPCSISSPQPVEGIDRETLALLRKRSTPLRLEEDKWRDTYQLLFPDVPEDEIPSPYYDGDSPSEESRRFRRELLRRIHQELQTTAEHMHAPVEQNLLRQVAAIIRRCENQLLNDFYQAGTSLSTHIRRQITPPPSMPPNITVTPATLPDYQSSHTYSQRLPPPPSPLTLSSTGGIASSTSDFPSSASEQHSEPSYSTGAEAEVNPAYWETREWLNIEWNAVFPSNSQPLDPASEPTLSHPFTMPVWD